MFLSRLHQKHPLANFFSLNNYINVAVELINNTCIDAHITFLSQIDNISKSWLFLG